MQKAWGPRGESRFLGEHSEESLEAGWGGRGTKKDNEDPSSPGQGK